MGTNELEYIKDKLTSRDYAILLNGSWSIVDDDKFASGSIVPKVWRAKNRWAESFSNNKGNSVKENVDNPSVFEYEKWFFPDGHVEVRGFSAVLSMEQFLLTKYDERWWME